MLWLVLEPRQGEEFMLAMPRQQPGEAATAWMQNVRRAARLNHPRLAKPLDIGEHDRWPFVVYERGTRTTWAERFSSQGEAATELADWLAQAAQGLAFAHEAGTAHHDLQPWWLAVDADQKVTVMGLELASVRPISNTQAGGLDELRAVRDAAAGDVLALGLVAHHGLAGAPAGAVVHHRRQLHSALGAGRLAGTIPGRSPLEPLNPPWRLTLGPSVIY